MAKHTGIGEAHNSQFTPGGVNWLLRAYAQSVSPGGSTADGGGV